MWWRYWIDYLESRIILQKAHRLWRLTKLKIREIPIAPHYKTFQLIFWTKRDLQIAFAFPIEPTHWNLNYFRLNFIARAIGRNPAAHVAVFLAQFAGHIVAGNLKCVFHSEKVSDGLWRVNNYSAMRCNLFSVSWNRQMNPLFAVSHPAGTGEPPKYCLWVSGQLGSHVYAIFPITSTISPAGTQLFQPFKYSILSPICGCLVIMWWMYHGAGR